MSILQRKKDHINIVLKKDIEPVAQSNFDKYRIPYKALPEIDLEEIKTEVDFFDWKIAFPFVLSSMTGGEQHGRRINKNVARACEKLGVPFGLGSMRCIIRHPETIRTFDVKRYAPNVPMFANVGLVQLNYGFEEKEVIQIVESVKADGLFIHLNHLQEAVQPEGDTNFKNLIPKLKSLIPKLKVPVVVKEVGHGIDYESAVAIYDCGVKYIDVAGVGGSSWAWIEGYRQPDYNESTNLGFLMRDIGIPTDESILECRRVSNDLRIIAGGGIRNGLDIAKSIALGANYATAAKPFLEASLMSDEAVAAVLRRWKRELQVSMFAAGVSNVAELQQTKLIK